MISLDLKPICVYESCNIGGVYCTFAPLWDGRMPSGASPNRRMDAAATKLALCYLKPRAGAHTALSSEKKENTT